MKFVKKCPYITAILAAALLAIVAWLCEPKEYTAITILSDEYKEMDLSIGFKELTKHIRNIAGGDNAGMNNMAVYCQLLNTEDFARSISHKRLPGENRTYGEYLCAKDTIGTIQSHLNYNYSNGQETLTISFTDKDPVIASQMLDSITAQLQSVITRHRQITAEAALQNARKYLSETSSQYKQAQKEYAVFSDSHKGVQTQQIKQEKKALRLMVDIANNTYRDAAQEYARQASLTQRPFMSFAVLQDNSVPMHSDKRLTGYLLSFVVLALLLTRAAVLYIKNRPLDFKQFQLGDYFSPWVLTVFIWGFILGLYYALDTNLYPITEQFYYSLILWLPIFCVCAFVTYVLTPADHQATTSAGGIDFNNSVFNFFFILSLIITPLYVYSVYQVVIMFGTEDLMNNLRMLAVRGGGQGFLNYSIVINQVLFIVALWAHPKVPTWKVVVLGIACLMNALAIMEKGSLLLLFVCILFVMFEKSIIKLRSILVSGVLVVVVFYFFNLARAVEGSDYQENETLMDFFIQYALSPPVAFCQLMQDVTPQFGANTFGSIYVFLSRFGADVVVKTKLQEFVLVPVPTNVYTIFQPFFIDFGYRGVAFFAAVYGVASGYLYRLFRSRNSVGTCLYTYLVYVLIMQFYQENIIISMVFILQFIIFTLLITQNKIRLSW